MTSMSCCVLQNGHTALDLAEREREDATAAVLRKVNALSWLVECASCRVVLVDTVMANVMADVMADDGACQAMEAQT